MIAATLPSLPTSNPKPMTTKLIRVGILSPINKLDPRDAVDYVSAVVLAQVFDTPYVSVRGEGAVRPQLFEPLRRENGLSTQFSAEVRPGIRFSDGTPLTAEIAVRSLRNSSVLTAKGEVELRGEKVWFTLRSPNPRFELTLAQSSCAIVLDKALQLLGTGPFMFAQRPNLRLLQAASSLNLVRNPHYAGTCAAEEVRFVSLPADDDGTPSRLIAALRAGEIDITTALSTGDLTTHQLTGVSAAMQPSNSTAVLFFNTERGLLRSRELRTAIAQAIDVHEIASAAYSRNPAAFVASSVLPPSMGRSVNSTMLDRAGAARLIEAAGARGARLTMIVPWGPRPYLPRPLQVAQSIQKQLADAGIMLTLQMTRSSDDFFQCLYGGNFDIALAGWIADTPDPADFYEALLWSQSIGGENHSNYGRWKHDPTDAALARFRGTPSETHRHDLDRLIHDEVPFIPLMYGQSTAVHSRRLRNVAISPIGILPLADVTM
jgi:ABC-type transport system substrate-binding protein